MFISLDYENVSAYQSFRHLHVIFTSTPSSELLNDFGNALDENGHLPYMINRKQLYQMPYVQIAHKNDGKFISDSTIKHCDSKLAEIGFMLEKIQTPGAGRIYDKISNIICSKAWSKNVTCESSRKQYEQHE